LLKQREGQGDGRLGDVRGRETGAQLEMELVTGACRVIVGRETERHASAAADVSR
jgi:hypothetical protein